MPNSPNAKKALRQNQKRRLHNRSQRSALRTAIKKVRLLAAEGKIDEANEAYNYAKKRLDQAAAKRLIHPNAAARSKSRLNKVLKSAMQPGAAS